MLKTYPNTEMAWDTENLRWVRLREKHPPKKQPIAIEEKPQKMGKDPWNMTWPEIRLDTYKVFRNSPDWEKIFKFHDQKDQEYFLMLDSIKANEQ